MGTEARCIDYDHGITAIDAEYVRPMLAASHLVVDHGRAAFVDTGTTLSIPNLLAALAARGIDCSRVDWVLTTHVHLDHAGGAGLLMQQLPNARCVVHPRGARHLADPTKLIAGSIDVYGEELFRRLYGDIVPIAEERIHVPADGERITLGKRTLELIHTPGHAQHHYCIVDLAHQCIFSGDTFGISYREFDVDGRAWVIPTTTPVQFDPDALLVSIDRLLAYQPQAMFLTHFGRVVDVPRLGADLKHRVTEFVRLARRHAAAPDRSEVLRTEMFRLLSMWLDEHGYAGDSAERHRLLDDDVRLNVQGIEFWLNR
jgi:glyoxylase-like metal-dependent hydrolase (beta-lactamase superfamily II)